MLFSSPECLAVPKICYPDRICSSSVLAGVLGRVVSEHFWPKKKLERLSVANQFIVRLAEFVALGINLHFSKYSPNHCISEVIFTFGPEAMLCLYFAFLVDLDTSASGPVPYLMVIPIVGRGACFRGGRKGRHLCL